MLVSLKSKITLIATLLICLAVFSYGQILKPAVWSYSQSTSEVNVGDEIELIFNADIEQNWYLYSSDFDPDLGPMVTEFSFEPDPSYDLIGGIRPINPSKAYDEIFEGDYTYFKIKGEFRQRIKVLSEKLNISGLYSYQVCSDVDGKCIPFQDDFSTKDFVIDVSSQGTNQNLIEESAGARTAESLPISSQATDIIQGSNSGLLHPAEWNVYLSKTESKKGDTIEIIFDASIDEKWYLYSSDFDPNLGPMVTEFHFEEDPSYELLGDILPINPSEGYDEVFEGNYTYFKKKGQFRQKLIIKDALSLHGSYIYQVCSDIDGKCIQFEDEFSFGKPRQENAALAINDYSVVNDDVTNSSMFGFMLFAFLSGLVALLTPCVFPMIPMTVTFFMKDEKDGEEKQGIRKALIFGISIILIFTIIGLLVAVLFGADTLNDLATHWFPNILVFIIFVVFALSFLGMFELTLPHSWVNKIDRKAEKGGLSGVFFMAATLALVSFSCTFPIVGSVLVLSTQGEFVKPVMGMLAFSVAFALPFSLFAAFPNWLKNLPKSGGWLNSVKVVLGFLELALGLKFLSVADQAYHWGLLDREIYIAFWIVIFAMMGFYLLGKIKMPHDSPLESVSVSRIMLSIITFTFVIYLIPGLWGAPLKALAGYLPPMSTHDFNVVEMMEDGNTNTRVGSNDFSELCDEPKYADLLHFPHGIKGYFDYQQAISCSRSKNKPLFIDFTGHGCVNCREMEARVWSDPRVVSRLKNDFVVVALYVDDKKTLPESEWYTSDYDGKVKKTIGKQNADFQITRYQNNAQPFYIILDGSEQLLASPLAYNLDVQNFIDFLDGAKQEFYNRQALARK